MATRICPQCGVQYVATVRRCIDCDVTLVDEATPDATGEATPPAGSTGAPQGTGDQVGYELEGWGNQLKVTLDGMLDKAGVHRAWEAGALVVSARHEETVDDLIATLEGGDIDELGDDAPQVALEIDGLDADGRAELDAQLLARAVPHAWEDDGALLVHEDDEEAVLAIIDQVFETDPDADGGDGLAAQEALSDVYVAVDRLVKHPHERKQATAYVLAARALPGLGIPYGFGAADWTDLVATIDALAVAVTPFAEVPDRDADDVDADADAGLTDVDDVDDGEDGDDGDGDDDGDDGDGDDGDVDDVDDGDDGESAIDRDRQAAQSLRARLVDLV